MNEVLKTCALPRNTQKLTEAFGRLGASTDLTSPQPDTINEVDFVPVKRALADGDQMEEYARQLRAIFGGS